MKVILYSTHCPKCEVLKKKLDNKGIDYDEVNNTEVMINKGFMQAPILEVDGEIMDFVKANKWINKSEES